MTLYGYEVLKVVLIAPKSKVLFTKKEVNNVSAPSASIVLVKYHERAESLSINKYCYWSGTVSPL
jgi:hypothetical protein